jgi:hypothetical protein
MTSNAAGRRKEGCPSDLDLDEMASGDLAGLAREAELRRHIDSCAICGPRLTARQADPALAPDPLVFRPLLSSLAATARVRARRRWMGLGGAFGSAAVAGLVLWGHRASAPDESAVDRVDRTKGALALTVHVKRAAANGRTPTVEAVNGEGALRAGEEMRFTVAASRPGFAVVLGLDGTPSVTIYVPAAGATARPTPVEATRPVTLPGSVIADETSGFERIVAVVCPTETSPDSLREEARAALARAGGRPEAVASLGTGCVESSVLLRKTAP